MGSFSGYFKGEKKKLRKETLEKKATHIVRLQTTPQVEIIGKGKGKK